MKRIMIMMLLGCLVFTACSKKTKKTVEKLSVERAVSLDKEYMFKQYEDTYCWFECCIVMKDYLDEETDGTVTGIANIFQVLQQKGSGYDTQVVKIAHTLNASDVEVVHGFWVEDFPLEDAEIKLTFEQAFDRLMATNLPKPHSKQCVLRKKVGPKACNPQYIFGNIHEQVYVDATTGEVSTEDPAYAGLVTKKLKSVWP